MDESFIRHILLNSIRQNRAKFYREYGELVFAVDSKNTWRKKAYKYYKANRKKSRDSMGLDWSEVYRIFDMFLDEIKTVFPYKVVKVDGTEGDDIIATLCMEYRDEKKLILSSDKDFIQLQKFPNIRQWDPFRKRWIKEKDPVAYLREHVIRGDSGDGVPNFLSDDDVLVKDGVRQKSIYKKDIEKWLQMDEDEFYRNLNEKEQANYMRNKMLIDLTRIPEDVRSMILQEYEKPIEGHRSKIMSYFIKHRMKMMMESLQDF